MTDSTSATANNKKPTTLAFRAGASVVALLLAPLSMGGCMSADDAGSESVGSVSQAICAANDLTSATTLTSSASSATSAGAFDNNVGTRWESTHQVDPQWIQVDLGASKFVSRVRLDWESANAKDYSIRISDDVNFATYTTLVTKTAMPEGNHRIDDLTGLSGTGRYVRMHGTARNLNYGYSIYEMDVYGDNAGCDAAPTGSCFKIKSQRTSNYLFNNAGMVTPGATAATAEIFEKIPNGNGFQFKATSNNTLVGITGDDLAVNGGGTVFTEYDCSSAGLYPNGKGYASPTGTGANWKANSTTAAVDTNNGGNAANCVNGSATAWERFYLESATCGGGSSCTPTTCAAQSKNCGSISDGCGGTLNCGTCGSGQACSANVCVASCTPTTCAAQGKNCGSISDGCGGTLTCGSCASGQTCSASNVCQASGGSSSKLEAESATNTGCALMSNQAGASGSAYLDGNAGAAITWTVSSTGGSQTLAFATKNPSGVGRKMGVFVNGAKVGVVTTDNVAPFTTKSVSATLVNGSNTIKLEDTEATGEPDVDYLEVTSGGGGGSCTATTCAAQGKTCGSISDGCGGTLSCGTCGAGTSCSASNVCVATCTPTSCAAQGKTCGTINDGCGGTLSCGTCGSGSTCTTSNVCQASSDPCGGACGAGQTCNLSAVCVTESCGGTCGMGQKCVNSACVNDTSSGAAYYNSGKALETVPAGFFGPNFKLYNYNADQAAIATDITTAYNAQKGGTDVCDASNQAQVIERCTTDACGSNGFCTCTQNSQCDTGVCVNGTCSKDSQFNDRRDSFMFLPGSYTAQLDIGFNTQIAGLGDSPDTTILSGRIMAMPPSNLGNNGTQTFWRVLENFKSTWTTSNNIWAVSQAAPMRRVHALGEISLHLDWGWQSGGYISDSVFDGKLHFGSQQQFYVRNSHAATAEAGVWNIMLQGVTGNRVNLAVFPTGPLTEVASAPIVREKPFLYVNRDGLFKVFVPALRTNASGAAWNSGPQAGTSIPLSKFHVVKPGSDPNADMAPAINAALSAGKHVLFTPGIYFIDAPLAVNNVNTVLLGIGLATITPRNGVNAINIADVDGVKLAGLLIDAGSATSSTASTHTLVQVGPAGSSASHAANPTSIHDLFARIGGRAWVGKAQRTLVVNSNDVIVDHTWLWRADHGEGVAWSGNTAANGMIVNGNNVISYATHVEHFQEYQVMWNGNNGKNYFFQNELPYEANSQNDLDNPNFYDLDNNAGTALTPLISNTGHGYASYKVAANVTNHEFRGGGCYAVFLMNACTSGAQCASGVCAADGSCTAPNPIMESDKCIETPTGAGIVFRNLLAQTLSNEGRINNLFNTDGRAAVPGGTYPKIDVP